MTLWSLRQLFVGSIDLFERFFVAPVGIRVEAFRLLTKRVVDIIL
jgi:hypothetical protein